MRILLRYITKEMAMPLLFGAAAFTSLFISGDLLNLANLVVQTGAPLTGALKVFVLKLPQVIVWTLPMSVLIATLLALSKLSASSEIVAMKAGGMSFLRIIQPVLLVALLMSALSFITQEVVVPAANTKARQVLVEEIYGSTLPTVTSHVVVKEQTGEHLQWMLYARQFDSKTLVLTDVTIITMEADKPRQVTYASRVIWDSNTWYMEEGVTHTLGDDAAFTMTFGSGRQPISLGQTPQQLAAGQKDPEQMSLAELKENIAVLRAQGAQVRDLEVKMHSKYSIPFAAIIFAMVGAPLGIQPHRSATSIGFGLSIILIFIYYTLMTFGSALGQGGYLPPWLAAWCQNIALGGCGLFLMAKQAR